MKIVAVVPVAGRESLLEYTISRLVRQVDKVIVGGQTKSECDVCETAGADFYTCNNGMMLGAKWQHLVDIARKSTPDAILIMGSASMISDNWCETLYPDLGESAMTGAAGIHYLHFSPKMQLVRWPGYIGGRCIEPIGVGRMISCEFLNKTNWDIFSRTINGGCDHSAYNNIQRKRGSINVNKSEDISSLRISSNKWVQKNSFARMSKLAGSKTLTDFSVLDNFPETKDMKL